MPSAYLPSQGSLSGLRHGFLFQPCLLNVGHVGISGWGLQGLAGQDVSKGKALGLLGLLLRATAKFSLLSRPWVT